MWRQEEEAGAVVAEGILGHTPIATPLGWRDAQSLRPGDMVLTFDCGPRALTGVQHARLDASAPPSLWPLRVAAFVLDNRAEITLLPEQKLLIDCDLAEDLYGDPFVLVPAAALEALGGIERCRPMPQAIGVRLGFGADQIVYASRGVMLSCPALTLAEAAPDTTPCRTLPLTEARALMARIAAKGDLGRATPII